MYRILLAGTIILKELESSVGLENHLSPTVLLPHSGDRGRVWRMNQRFAASN